MKITLATQGYAEIPADALVCYAFEAADPVQGRMAELDAKCGGLLRRLSQSGELTGKPLEMTLVHAPAGFAAQRLLIVGAGKKEKYGTPELRKLAGAALRFLKARSVKRIAFLAREGDATADAAQAAAEGLIFAAFDGEKYKSEDKDGKKRVESVVLAGWDDRAAGEKGLERGRVIAEAQNFSRDLVNEPSNRLTPKILAERAAEMAGQAGLACEILDEKRIAELKMGALLGVAQGSIEPPRVIVTTYAPAEARSGGPVIGLIGKAVTFDTGGISIKPAEGMEKMKYDMAGGATMLGVMRALAALKPRLKVISVVPATENMPGGRAQKPGDVQVAMSGKTIEVLNTDAEGRLILADAITYAKQLGCTHLIDAATLTGAIVVALANVNAGVFGSDEKFTARLLASAKACGEKMWPMPVDEEYREFIKGTVADIQNIGSGKGGGAITAAMFLKEFTGDTPWIHLDIAGTAWLDENKPWAAKGATAIGLRTLVDLVTKFV
ncbi:MAG TPA: leucyl aminopeptidase [Methylomirabilota bacterium]|nr:leucyl aminopeptidase [Methylomirabilota bacterium]